MRAPVLTGAALIVVLTCLAYAPAVRGGFVLDDNILLTNNRLIQAPDGVYRFWFTTEAIDYWPVTNTNLWIEWRLWGMDPTGYHVTNLLLHIAAVFLIWTILRRMSVPGAFLAALLFAVHPVNVESVAWIAQRKSLLAMVFFLFSILAFVNSAPPSRSRAPSPAVGRWYWLSIAAFALAMLSKGSVAFLPFLLLLIVRWSRPLTRDDLMRSAPFFAIAVVLVGVNMWFQTHGTGTEFRTATLTERILGAAAGVWFYLYKAVLPIDLAFIYPQWHIRADQLRWWVPLSAAAVTSFVLWRYRDTWGRPFWFAWATFCVALVPVLGFTDVAFMEHSLVADHYQHLALIAVVALAAAGWATWQRGVRAPKRWGPTGAAALIVAALTVLTLRQSSLYVDAETLYRATLAKNPDSWLAHNNLGGVLTETGRTPEAIEHYEQALRLKPDYPDAHNNLGVALRAAGRLPEAITHYEEALRLRPNYVAAHYNLGVALAQNGQQQDAIAQFDRALAIYPEYAEAHNDLGAALAQTSHLSDAIAHFNEALRLRPDFADAQYNLRLALAMQQNQSHPAPH